jgi:Type II secretion system protein C
MRKHLAASNQWTWCAAALCLAAAVFLGWQLARNDEIAVVSSVQSADETHPAENERQLASFKMPPAEEYEDILSRPLFNRSRRPEIAQENPQASGDNETQGTPAANISLNGIVVARGRRVALLRLDNDPKVMHVAEGQQAGGWLIEAIRADRIILRRGDTASEVALDYRRQSGGSVTQAAQPPENQPKDNVGEEEEAPE